MKVKWRVAVSTNLEMVCFVAIISVEILRTFVAGDMILRMDFVLMKAVPGTEDETTEYTLILGLLHHCGTVTLVYFEEIFDSDAILALVLRSAGEIQS